ncbi:MAG: hypothetical protein WC849_02495 [Candidatus Paceibacterota bacterium]
MTSKINNSKTALLFFFVVLSILILIPTTTQSEEKKLTDVNYVVGDNSIKDVYYNNMVWKFKWNGKNWEFLNIVEYPKRWGMFSQASYAVRILTSSNEIMSVNFSESVSLIINLDNLFKAVQEQIGKYCTLYDFSIIKWVPK